MTTKETQQAVNQEINQATNQAQTAENGQPKTPVQIEPQYQLNHFFANLTRLKKNLIRVANVQLNPQGLGAFVGSPAEFWHVFGRSQSTDLLVSYRTFGQLKPEIAQTIKDITDPNAITEIKVAFGIGNQSVTAHYTLLNIKEGIEQFYKEAATAPGKPDDTQIDDNLVLEKAS
ncbi:hypothetical protein [Acinetobacter sp. YH12153]|uniref:hypothetical protein n=1 Tax=Acinetobacter sp. YH12153 TaxID=2601133 RepID=UPI0015D2518E|nr:hypothetical protein [Acinetobacter sp. YH12153]